MGILEELLERIIKIENILLERQQEEKARNSKNGLSTDEVIREALEKKFNDKIDKYPLLLEIKDVKKILGIESKSQVYGMLNKNQVPGANKIPGMGWRVNRDVFFGWLYKNEV